MIAIVIMHNLHRHMDEEDLERYSSGTGSETDVALYEEHLLTCERCRSKVREADEYRSAMRFAIRRMQREERTARQEAGWRMPAGFPVYAAVACLALLMVFAVRSRAPQPGFAVTLSAMRGDGGTVSAPANRSLVLHPDLTGIAPQGSYRLELVGRNGDRLWQGSFTPSPQGVRIPKQAPGLYFVDVYVPQGTLVREYGLEIK
jgi:anti-sigma factor RsiW